MTTASAELVKQHLVVPRCPYCDGRHVHGRIVGEPRRLFRAAHCRDGGLRQYRLYVAEAA